MLVHGQWFSPGTPASYTTKTGRHDIAEILLKMMLNTINQSINSLTLPISFVAVLHEGIITLFFILTGNYPLHFHMCHDMVNYPRPPYLRKNSIYKTFARCMTIHGSHGATVSFHFNASEKN